MPHLSSVKHSAPSRLPAQGKALPIQAGEPGSCRSSQLKCSNINNTKASALCLCTHVFVCVCVSTGGSNSSVWLPNLSMKDYLCMCKLTHTANEWQRVSAGKREAITTVLFLAPETTLFSSAMPHIYFDLCSENEEMRQWLLSSDMTDTLWHFPLKPGS